ncbi:MAG: alpha-L-rhamnosidase N-terminal domain-containing protein, partial [Kiritimatiellales bacterium]
MALELFDLKSNGTEFGFFDRNEIYFSWKTRRDQPNGRQAAWQVRAAGNSTELESGPYLWDSGWVESDQSVEVPYAGAPLISRQCVVWQVRIRDTGGNQSDWSKPARFETAFLEQSDWSAQWIQMPRLPEDKSVPAPFFRKSFKLSEQPVSARLYVAALGDGEFYLNGTRVGNDYFSPGWTDFSKRIQYLTYDVSTLLQDGENAIGVILGDGWYSGRISWKNMHHFYGTEPRLRLQLEVRMQDG